MALQFTPYPFLGRTAVQSDALKQEKFNQLNDTLLNIARMAQQNRQFNVEDKRRQALEELARGRDTREQATMEYEIGKPSPIGPDVTPPNYDDQMSFMGQVPGGMASSKMVNNGQPFQTAQPTTPGLVAQFRQWKQTGRTGGAKDFEMGRQANLDALNQMQTEADINRTNAMADYYRQKPNSMFKAPSGYRYTSDGNLEKIPGGPADQKDKAAIEKEKATLDNQKRDAELVISAIDEALGLVGPTTAGLGSLLSNVPNTDAMDLSAVLDTINSQLGLGKLMEMKSNSKAGASGMGALSDREMTLLISALSSLKQKQSPDQLRKHLNDVKTHYQNLLKLGEGINPFEQGGSSQPIVEDGYEYIGGPNGDKGDPRNWRKING